MCVIFGKMCVIFGKKTPKCVSSLVKTTCKPVIYRMIFLSKDILKIYLSRDTAFPLRAAALFFFLEPSPEPNY